MAYFYLRLLAACVVFATARSQLSYVVVDTGVTGFSDANRYITSPRQGQSFYGQDATYNGTQPAYRDNRDGTITDLNTGLMWQKSMGLKMTYSQARSTVSTFNLAGNRDWRIPTIKELFSLIQYSGSVAGPTGGTKRFIDTRYFDQPIGNTALGERDIDAQTLSRSIYTGLAFDRENCSFGVNFIDGRIKCYPLTMRWYFRFVRDNTVYGKNNFESNGDGTISDSATGLMWQQADSGRGMNWQTALAYCENLNFAGYTDWRLPNAKELQSIVDYSRSPWKKPPSPAIDPLFTVSQVTAPNGQSNFPYYWSGTTLKDGPMPTDAMYVCMGKCYGKQGNSLLDVHGAGAMRSDPKSAGNQQYPKYHGPQGDMQVVYNYVKCVRNI